MRRRAVLGGAATTVAALAGCVGGGDDDVESDQNETDGNDTDAGEATDDAGVGGGDEEGDDGDVDGEEEAADDGMQATVQVEEHDEYGDILVNEDGLTLYIFQGDSQGSDESECQETCAQNWPPLTIEDDRPYVDGSVTAELTTFERQDGPTQVAADGRPLYTFVFDDEPGEAEGQGVNDEWWVLQPDGTPIEE